MSAVDAAAQRLLARVGDALPGAELIARVERDDAELTRFADSAIHQNVADSSWSMTVTAHRAGRTVTQSIGASGPADDGAAARLAELVTAGLASAPGDPGWPGVAERAEVAEAPEPPRTSAIERADAVAAFVAGAGGLSTAGYVQTRQQWSGIATSGGQVAVEAAGWSGLDGIARRDGVDGVFRAGVARLADLDPYAAGALAAAKVRAGDGAVQLEPGRYEVVLEPAAAANLVQTLALWGFNGRAHNDGSTFAQVGADQLDSAITMVDDGPAWGAVVDMEGTPKARQTFVENGRTTLIAHDRRTAAEAGTVSTGHLVPVTGPMPLHLGIQPGPGMAAVDDGPAAGAAVPLLAGVRRGLLISDLWYTRVLDPRQVTVTGLTRNGVWLVEDGEVVGPVQNVRFTQSYPDALAPGRVLGVGPVAVSTPNAWGTTQYATPALHLASWNVTGNASG